MSVIRRIFGSTSPAVMLVAAGLWMQASGQTMAAGEAAGAPAVKTPVSQSATTGFAIDGFDPVSYFTEGLARQGQNRLEARWNDAAWRFANPGNRDAFLDDPDIYAPRFGGFGLVALARGQLVDGDPEVFVLHEGRLYLFHSPQNRMVFLRAPGDFVAAAEENWRRINHLPKPVAVETRKAPSDQPGVSIFE
ncbi:MAG: hypothetical protein H6878_03710 [Rhodobiaceae bacterium]|nr:hypothetical protein [Rhodobiaceae bacterium]MCC0053367.1 hypothetical protein [Rhodobiaceae bacterium]